MDAVMEYMLKSYRKIKADAIPQPPRSSKSEKIPPKHKTSNSATPEEVLIESEDYFVESDDEIEIEENNSPPKKGKKKCNKNNENGKQKKSKIDNEQRENGSIVVNTLAKEGNVMTIINCNGIHIGDRINIGPTHMKQPKTDDFENPEENIKKTNIIEMLFNADIKPELEYLMYVKNNLGKNWRSIFVKLGFTKGEIETTEAEYKAYGVKEARYQLLLVWVGMDEGNTLGRLARFLWDVKERCIVKKLAEMYDKRS